MHNQGWLKVPFVAKNPGCQHQRWPPGAVMRLYDHLELSCGYMTIWSCHAAIWPSGAVMRLYDHLELSCNCMTTWSCHAAVWPPGAVMRLYEHLPMLWCWMIRPCSIIFLYANNKRRRKKKEKILVMFS